MKEIAAHQPSLNDILDAFMSTDDAEILIAIADLPKMENGMGLALMIECDARGLHMLSEPTGHYRIIRPKKRQQTALPNYTGSDL